MKDDRHIHVLCFCSFAGFARRVRVPERGAPRIQFINRGTNAGNSGNRGTEQTRTESTNKYLSCRKPLPWYNPRKTYRLIPHIRSRKPGSSSAGLRLLLALRVTTHLTY
jgi:hypothetical protein